MTARTKALERNLAMGLARDIATGQIGPDADGSLPLLAVVESRARPRISARRVIAILQGWQWVRRVGPDRWTLGDGAADRQRAARAAFPHDGRCAACTQDLGGAYTVAGGGQLVLCVSCAKPVRSGVHLDDLAAVVAALLGARSAPKASRLANRLRARLPALDWAAVRRREVEERRRFHIVREGVAHGLRHAVPAWRTADEGDNDLAGAPTEWPRHARRHSSAGEGHLCRVCGRQRANERFSGKGHAKHVCKDCDRAERRARRAAGRG